MTASLSSQAAGPAPSPQRPPAIQPLDATALRAVLSELRPLLLPSRFEKAQQADPHTVQLGLRGLRGSHWLSLSWLAEAPRLHAIPTPPRQGEGSTLARQLQHGLRGLALTSLEQQGWERVVELGFAPRPGEPPQRWLVLEVMGRHSNLFLLDGERRVICLGRQVKASQSRRRPIGTGDPYRPPPPLQGELPSLAESPQRWRQRLSLLPQPLGEALLGCYAGLSPALLRQLLEGRTELLTRPVQSLSEADWQGLERRWHAWLEAVAAQRFHFQPLAGPAGDGYRLWSPIGAWEPPQPGSITAAPQTGTSRGDTGAAAGPAAPQTPGPAARQPAPAGATAGDPLAINHALAGYYGSRLAQRQLIQERASLRQRLVTAIGREREALAQQQRLLDAVPAGEELQQQAHALLSRPDPDRQSIDEAQALYRRARKLRRSAAAITPRLAWHQQRLEHLEASLTFLEQAEDQGQLLEIRAELDHWLQRRSRDGSEAEAPPSGRAAARSAARADTPQPLELRTGGGLRLQIGRNHRQNDWISLRQARRGDLWFHAQECPGSHVVLKASEAPAGEADLQAAADLAAHFSRARGNRRVPVLQVPVESLQRLAGAGPGTVRHRGGEVLWGEPGRAAALLHALSLSREEQA
ncbi:MAG: NFACT family protein [Synechococcaceae cyanobacterium]|nr:NFACT family protein [Synechococcaceae cyanobacterium]